MRDDRSPQGSVNAYGSFIRDKYGKHSQIYKDFVAYWFGTSISHGTITASTGDPDQYKKVVLPGCTEDKIRSVVNGIGDLLVSKNADYADAWRQPGKLS